MKERNSYDYIIVGAGPSGLVCAYELQKRGFTCLIVDRDNSVGGLSKSVRYEKQNDCHIFDTGPKRFHSDDQVVIDFLNEISSFSVIGRSTEVFFGNRFLEWPLRTSQIPLLPKSIALKTALDLIQKLSKQQDNAERVHNPSRSSEETSFKSYILEKYGKTLFESFFRPYTEKFLRWNVEDIHADWASTGINRTVIDERVDATSSLAILKGLILPKKNETNFLYPTEGGFGGFFENLYQKIISNKTCARVELNSCPTLVKTLKNQQICMKIDSSPEEFIAVRGVVWTGNLNDLSKLLGFSSKLNYLNTIFYDVIVPEDSISRKRAQWTYISDGRTLISRVTSMKEFNENTTPNGYYNLVAEVTDSQSFPVYFDSHKALSSKVVEELKAIGFINKKGFVDDIHSRPVRDTYPIYNLEYRNAFNIAHRKVKQFSRNIHLLGRSGAFWYNNSDHSIRMSLELVKKLSGETNKDFDYRGYFGGKPNH